MGGGIVSPQADAIQRGVLCLREMSPAVWVITQNMDPGGCSLSFLFRATNCDSPQASLVHSSLPLPVPRVSGCKPNFVLWPFKRLCASPDISPWLIEPLLLFTAGYYLGSFSGSGAVGWRTQLGV